LKKGTFISLLYGYKAEAHAVLAGGVCIKPDEILCFVQFARTPLLLLMLVNIKDDFIVSIQELHAVHIIVGVSQPYRSYWSVVGDHKLLSIFT